MRILAIGDIHGCASMLETLLNAVAPTPEDTLVTLGDYVDRGLESPAVLERLIALIGNSKPGLCRHWLPTARSRCPA